MTVSSAVYAPAGTVTGTTMGIFQKPTGGDVKFHGRCLKPTPLNRRRFTPELKAESVDMVRAADGNIAQVAREMGIYDSTLGKIGCASPGPRPTVPRPPRSERSSASCAGSWSGPAVSGTSWQSSGLLLGVPEDQRVTALYSFIAEEKADPRSPWRVAEMCRTLGVSRQGFHDWEARPPSNHQVTDRLLAAEIEAIWECSARTYGPRVHAWLGRQGYRVSRKRVARIMRRHGWVGISGRRRVRTTIVDRSATAADDLVARNFDPVAPDVTWAGDITYIPTGEGWLFLATVIDLFSRRVIGWGGRPSAHPAGLGRPGHGSRHPGRSRRRSGVPLR